MTETARLASDMTCWTLTSGLAGCDTQVLGVAEALGVTPEMKHVAPPVPWRWMAPWGRAAPQTNVTPPWPDLLIVAGRQSIPYARMIRRASGGRTFTAVLQNPRISPAHFDFVWAPAHDRLTGANVLSTVLSPHRLTRARLDAEAKLFEPKVAHLPRPRIAVLLGGTNSAYRLTQEVAARIAAQLAGLMDHHGAGLMVTPSRRTGERQSAIIREALADKAALMWDGTGANPYFGFLGLADAVVVTCDSVNMVGEAVFTGKPVYVIELEGGAPKFRRFLDAVYTGGAARPFAGTLKSWSYEPLDATAEIAGEIAKRFAAHRARIG
tara:strand:+ start:3678 stop:4649 length:972 start_codon:yes stop_codon:yes gene_type:complete